MLENLVELVGIEPTTSSLRTMRSPVNHGGVFNRLPQSDKGNDSIYWNVIGTCGSQVVRLNP